MKFIIEVEIAKEKMNENGKSVNEFDFRGLINTIQNFDKDYLRVNCMKPKEK